MRYILQEERDSLMYNFLMAQMEYPTRNDWGQTVLKDIEEFQLDVTLDEIQKMSPFQFSSIPEIPRSNTGSIFDSHQEKEEPRRVPQKAQIPVFETNNEVSSKDHPFSETLFPTHDNRDKSELIETFTTPKPFVSSLGAIGTAKPSTNGESARLVVSALPKFNYHTSPGPHVTSLSPIPNGPAFGPTLHPYHPAPHHPDPHHAYGVPEPIYHDSQYGVPEPVHPAPGYGVPHAPIHHPTPGYGVPEPVHHPEPGYGAPEPGKATSDSMTSLLTHTVAHSTRPKTNNQVS